MQLKNILKYFLAFIITAGALYLAFRGQDFDAIGRELSRTSIWALVLSALFQILAHFVRGWRWQFLLRPVKEKTGLFTAFKAVMAGYAMNNVIPRSGELIRPAMASVEEKMPFAGTLATIIVERIFDVIALGLLFVFSFFSYEKEFQSAFPDLAGAKLPLLIIISAGLIVFVAIFVSKGISRFFLGLIHKIFPKKLADPLARAFETFTSGLHGLKRDTALPIILGTVGVWACYTASTFCGIYAIPGSGIEAIGLKGAIVLLALAGIAITIPTPGGTGTYHYFISQALILFFGISPSTAVAFATVTHASNYIVITVIGLFFMFSAGVSLKTAKKKEEGGGA
ncbi:MAG: lysylphosphatidylglycerol synthase transmembrane domain-containing protein [Bacteroidota bacterium]|nr:lysylphosphatidylglycerol synthase transmembrane domain-containing protein [Bacteroidota bacterium]